MTVTYQDIYIASKRIAGQTVYTPLLENRKLNQICDARIFIKPECLQHTGSFKFRGAYHAVSSLDKETRTRGVIAYSSGNHAQSIALAAKLFGIPSTLIMPQDAPQIKRDNTCALGANVICYNRYSESREDMTKAIQEESKAILIPPYDYAPVIAGQGTLGLEAAQELEQKGIHLDYALASCGGGGMIAGMSIALHHHFPNVKIYACEPEYYDDTKRSLETGVLQKAQTHKTTLCDAIMTPEPGTLTFPINKQHLEGGLSISEEETLAAIAFALENLKMVIEPGGVIPLAALLSRKLKTQGKNILIVLSGGNIDNDVIKRALDQRAHFTF